MQSDRSSIVRLLFQFGKEGFGEGEGSGVGDEPEGCAESMSSNDGEELCVEGGNRIREVLCSITLREVMGNNLQN